MGPTLMNTALRRTLLALLICSTLPALVFAGGKLKPKEPFKPAYDVVQAVDPTANSVTIGHANSTDTSTKTYKLDKFSEVEVNGEKASLADVKPGMKASVTPGVVENTASRLVVSPAPPEPTPYPTPKPRPGH